MCSRSIHLLPNANTLPPRRLYASGAPFTDTKCFAFPLGELLAQLTTAFRLSSDKNGNRRLGISLIPSIHRSRLLLFCSHNVPSCTISNRVDCSCACSIGSPTSVPSSNRANACAVAIVIIPSGPKRLTLISPSACIPFSPFIGSTTPATPSTTNCSPVSVPVLSKHNTSNLPANGIRNGSVQYIAYFDNAINDEFTAIDSSIGNSGGTTDVIIRIQSSNTLVVVRRASFIPWCHTYPAAKNAKHNKNNINMYDSLLFAVTCSVLNIMVRTNSPCAVPNPVRNTTHVHPPSGVIIVPFVLCSRST
ncbi:hypothetical protein AX774_g894 [Zancudomyces culisetae]|nr:hypothetical protein AX774_g894 [Zancudomyces culisetae]|eukprot:OMH85555.1 hypothetical protein AX774_g894 [Zancudomyces culisetae]